MKKSNWEWVVVLIIIVLVIGIGIGIFLSTSAESTDPENSDRKSKLDLIKSKIKALEERVKNEIAQLKLTTEMENELSQKADLICVALGATFVAILVLIAAAFNLGGVDILTAILSTAGLVSLALPLLSIVLWKSVDFNSVVAFTRGKVKLWLNKKYGHNPDSIVVLRDSISEVNGSIEKQNQQLNALLSPIGE